MGELEDYVRSQRQEGCFDSSGRFTLVRAQALERISQAGLACDTHALYKLIQACVGWGSQEIWLFTASHELAIFCRTSSAEIVDLSARFEALVLDSADSPERDLALGLCHFLARKPSLMGMARWSEGERVDWQDLDGGAAPARRPPARDLNGVSIHIRWARPGPTLALAETELKQACFFAPATIRLNASFLAIDRVTPFLPKMGADPRSFWTGRLGRPALEYHSLAIDPRWGTLASRPIGQGLVQVGLYTAKALGKTGSVVASLQCVGKLGDGPPTFLAKPKLSPMEALSHALARDAPAEIALSGGIVYLTGKPTSEELQESLVFPLKRGVLLHPLMLKLPTPAAIVVLPADGILCDLGQLRILESEIAGLAVRAQKQVEEALEICCSCLRLLPDMVDDEGLSSRVTLGGLGGGLLFGLGFGLVVGQLLPPVAGFVGLVCGALGGVCGGGLARNRDKKRHGASRRAEREARFLEARAALRAARGEPPDP